MNTPETLLDKLAGIIRTGIGKENISAIAKDLGFDTKIDGLDILLALAKNGLRNKRDFSHNESIVKKYLDDNKHTYVRQKTFDGCYDKDLLYFDFYLPEWNLAIEVDGAPHFFYISSLHNTLEGFYHVQRRDGIKNRYVVGKMNFLRVSQGKIHDFANIFLNFIHSLQAKEFIARYCGDEYELSHGTWKAVTRGEMTLEQFLPRSK